VLSAEPVAVGSGATSEVTVVNSTKRDAGVTVRVENTVTVALALMCTTLVTTTSTVVMDVVCWTAMAVTVTVELETSDTISVTVVKVVDCLVIPVAGAFWRATALPPGSSWASSSIGEKPVERLEYVVTVA